MNWQLRGGRHMYALRGGAWLTADFVEAAVGDSTKVLKPTAEESLENVPPERIIHSLLTLDSCSKPQRKDKLAHWVVTRFDGFVGPTDPAKPEVKPVQHDCRDTPLVLLDDAGNGFRDNETVWPLALTGCTPLVIHKVRRPLARGKLWKYLEPHADRTIALLSADDLRGDGGKISRGLSWEQTATDLFLSLSDEPRFLGLQRCPFIVVPLALEGAMLVLCKDGKVKGAHLWYIPNQVEGDLLRMGRGDMSGFGSAFAAAIAAALAQKGLNGSSTPNAIEGVLRDTIPDALRAEHNLLKEAFGECRPGRRPEYPHKEIFRSDDTDDLPLLSDVALPELPAPRTEKDINDFKAWRILDSKRTGALAGYAAEVVRCGVDQTFRHVPIGRFGKLDTLDRNEIESYRSIRNLIREFLDKPKPERPLCLAVFGPPGGGKSFGVTQVARSIDSEGLIDKLSFNISQWSEPAHLGQALHRVSDAALRGKVPLVFFDEFDSQLGIQELGWLKYFLAPMQDGVFSEGLFDYVIGKSIFVFAGGTAHSFAEFRDKAKEVKQKSAKAQDFLSRLRGYVDIFGFDPPANTNLLRRALVLRSKIIDKYPPLSDASGNSRIDPSVLRALLHIDKFAHGARSLEAILEMSNLAHCSQFDPSALPSQHQLDLHVKSAEFMALVQQQQILGAKLEEMAKAIHESYLQTELAKRDGKGQPVFQPGDRPALHHWDDLDNLYKNSNREQAANYPILLAAAGCGFEVGQPDPKFEFTLDDVTKLAQLEHERWMEERRIKQPNHPDRRPWDELTSEEKEKDIKAVKNIPEILGQVNLRVIRLI